MEGDIDCIIAAKEEELRTLRSRKTPTTLEKKARQKSHGKLPSSPEEAVVYLRNLSVSRVEGNELNETVPLDLEEMMRASGRSEKEQDRSSSTWAKSRVFRTPEHSSSRSRRYHDGDDNNTRLSKTETKIRKDTDIVRKIIHKRDDKLKRNAILTWKPDVRLSPQVDNQLRSPSMPLQMHDFSSEEEMSMEGSHVHNTSSQVYYKEDDMLNDSKEFIADTFELGKELGEEISAIYHNQMQPQESSLGKQNASETYPDNSAFEMSKSLQYNQQYLKNDVTRLENRLLEQLQDIEQLKNDKSVLEKQQYDIHESNSDLSIRLAELQRRLTQTLNSKEEVHGQLYQEWKMEKRYLEASQFDLENELKELRIQVQQTAYETRQELERISSQSKGTEKIPEHDNEIKKLRELLEERQKDAEVSNHENQTIIAGLQSKLSEVQTRYQLVEEQADSQCSKIHHLESEHNQMKEKLALLLSSAATVHEKSNKTNVLDCTRVTRSRRPRTAWRWTWLVTLGIVFFYVLLSVLSLECTQCQKRSKPLV